MKSINSKLALSLCLLLTSTTSFAGTPILDQREQNQKQRIKQGVKSGELTKKETARLIKGQKQLHKMERRAKADGVVTRNERVKLQRKANKESAKIARNKHDGQSRD